MNLSGSKFPIFKPERPHIDIPSAVAHRTGGAGSSADNDSLRTPIDLPTSHPDTPWYGSQYPYGPYNPLSLTDGLTLVPPGASYDVQQSLPEYDDFSRVCGGVSYWPYYANILCYQAVNGYRSCSSVATAKDAGT